MGRARDRATTLGDAFLGVQETITASGTVTSRVEKWRSASDVIQPVVVERCWDRVNPGPPYLRGGGFDLWRSDKSDLLLPSGSVTISRTDPNTGTETRYVGGFVPGSFGPFAFSSSDLQNVGNSGAYSGSFGDPSPYGASAYNKARPKVEKADAAVFTGEFREVPGQFKQSAKYFNDAWRAMGGNPHEPFMTPKRQADEFINYQFGWSPFVNDLGKFYDTFVNTERYIAQLKRSNGSWQKRRVTVTTDLLSEVKSTSYTNGMLPSLTGLLYKNRVVDGRSCNGVTKYISASSKRVWFEGSFRFYLPYFDPVNEQAKGNLGALRRYMALYGARINPSTVWNLTPWSWAVDWVSSVGDSLDNLSSITYDGLASRYAFIMATTHHQRIADCTLFGVDGDHHFSFSSDVVTKRRGEASPFGFGLTWENFTPRQIAIAGALGISRAS